MGDPLTLTKEQHDFIDKMLANGERLTERATRATELGLPVLASFLKEVNNLIHRGVEKQTEVLRIPTSWQGDKTKLLVDAMERRGLLQKELFNATQADSGGKTQAKEKLSPETDPSTKGT